MNNYIFINLLKLQIPYKILLSNCPGLAPKCTGIAMNVQEYTPKCTGLCKKPKL